MVSEHTVAVVSSLMDRSLSPAWCSHLAAAIPEQLFLANFTSTEGMLPTVSSVTLTPLSNQVPGKHCLLAAASNSWLWTVQGIWAVYILIFWYQHSFNIMKWAKYHNILLVPLTLFHNSCLWFRFWGVVCHNMCYMTNYAIWLSLPNKGKIKSIGISFLWPLRSRELLLSRGVCVLC